MKRIFISLITLFIAIAGTKSQTMQDSNSILNNVEKHIEEYNAFKVEFTINNSPATITIMKNMFKLEAGDVITWYDGKTQWTYIKDSNEVNITEPEANELNGLNPYHFIREWKKNFKNKYIGEKNIKGIKTNVVRLIPNEMSDYEYFDAYINNSYDLVYVSVMSTTDETYNINIKKVDKNIKVSNSIFKFNEKQYPNADIIDLR